jgi:hypothetical protein
MSYDVMSQAPEVTILQGRYLEGVFSDKGYLKWLWLETDRGEKQIKLPKFLAYSLSQEAKPGSDLRVWARPKKDYFKALMVVPLAPMSQVIVSQVIVSPPVVPAFVRSCTIQVCQKGGCRKRGSLEVWQALEQQIHDRSDSLEIRLETSSCLKNCKQGPNLRVLPDKVCYQQVQPEQVALILKKQGL